MSNKIKVVICRVGQQPTVELIEHDLKTMQKLVGGFIERGILAVNPDIDIWFNDDSHGLKPNRLVPVIMHRSKVNIPLFGDFFITGHDGKGETISLTDVQAIEYQLLVNMMPTAIPDEVMDSLLDDDL